jgi:hypothetical protein
VAAEALVQWAIRSRALVFIAFDGTTIPTIDRLVQIYTASTMRELPMHIAFPDADLRRLCQAGRPDLSQTNRLKHMLRQVRKPRADRKPAAPDSKLFAPIDIFCENIDDQFVEFIPKGSQEVPDAVVSGLNRTRARAALKEESGDSGDGAQKPLRIPPATQSRSHPPKKTMQTVRTISPLKSTRATAQDSTRNSTRKRETLTKRNVDGADSSSDDTAAPPVESIPEKRAAGDSLLRRSAKSKDTSSGKRAQRDTAPGPLRQPTAEFELGSDARAGDDRPPTRKITTAPGSEVHRMRATKTRQLPTGTVDDRYTERTRDMRVRGPEGQEEWQFPVQYVPEIDNSKIVERLNEKHSLETLLVQVRRT